MNTETSKDMSAWLGDAVGDLDKAQTARFYEAAQWASARWPDPDDQPDRDAALSAAVQYLLGDVRPADLGQVLAQARAQARAASIACQAVARMLCEDGMIESQAATLLRINRLTVRTARGK